MQWKQFAIIVPLAFLLISIGCLDMPEVAICSSGRVCPPGMYCAAIQDICITGPCGNGVKDVDEGEECDDGNRRWGDDCPPDCGIPSANIAGVSDAPTDRIESRPRLNSARTCTLGDAGAACCWGSGYVDDSSIDEHVVEDCDGEDMIGAAHGMDGASP